MWPSAQLLVRASRQKLPHSSICICVWTSLNIARAIARVTSPLSDAEGGDATSCSFFLENLMKNPSDFGIKCFAHTYISPVALKSTLPTRQSFYASGPSAHAR